MKYEYLILKTTAPTATEEQLTGFGTKGWELCQIVEWQGEWYYYFKRIAAAQ